MYEGLQHYIDGRITMDRVGRILYGIKEVNWIPSFSDGETTTLQSEPGGYRLNVHRSMIDELIALPTAANGIKKACLTFTGSFSYDGHRFNFTPFYTR